MSDERTALDLEGEFWLAIMLDRDQPKPKAIREWIAGVVLPRLRVTGMLATLAEISAETHPEAVAYIRECGLDGPACMYPEE